MKVLLSPTKQLQMGRYPAKQLPRFLDESRQIAQQLQAYDASQLQALMRINETIAKENVKRYADLQFTSLASSAFFSYDGLAFKHMHRETFDADDLRYVEEHIRILSGLYGLLRPMDGIEPYRLEMQTKLEVAGCKNLYAFWQHKLADALLEEEGETPLIINLASKEYAKVVAPYLPDMVTITFYVEKGGKLTSGSTAVKMARGAMVHAMVKNRWENVAELRQFAQDGYVYSSTLSTPLELVFVKTM